jgi:hypothetical protein
VKRADFPRVLKALRNCPALRSFEGNSAVARGPTGGATTLESVREAAPAEVPEPLACALGPTLLVALGRGALGGRPLLGRGGAPHCECSQHDPDPEAEEVHSSLLIFPELARLASQVEAWDREGIRLRET